MYDLLVDILGLISLKRIHNLINFSQNSNVQHCLISMIKNGKNPLIELVG